MGALRFKQLKDSKGLRVERLKGTDPHLAMLHLLVLVAIGLLDAVQDALRVLRPALLVLDRALLAPF